MVYQELLNCLKQGRPKDSAIIAENDGQLNLEKNLEENKKFQLLQTETGTSSSYLIPKGKHKF